MTQTGELDPLRGVVAGLESVLVAFSGGVDSTFLLKVCRDVLGDRCLAVTVGSELHPAFEQEEARRLAEQMGARWQLVQASVLGVDGIRLNPPYRCYHCKKHLFTKLLEMAREQDLRHVADGANADDADDFRPGARATAELGVRSPLKEAGLTKAAIRRHSRDLGLPTWDKPSCACLASRLPYGMELTPQRLAAVDRGEQALRELGFRQVRLRHHDQVARIELPPDELARAIQPELRRAIVEALRAIGYSYVTLDLQGYRTGSMNEVL